MEYDFTQYRTVLGFQKSKKYLKWMKEQFPHDDLHHCLGSVFNRKFTDYLIVPINHKHHLDNVEPHKAYWFNWYFAQSVRYLLQYARRELKIDAYKIAELLPNYEPENVKAFIEAVYQKENE